MVSRLLLLHEGVHSLTPAGTLAKQSDFLQPDMLHAVQSQHLLCYQKTFPIRQLRIVQTSITFEECVDNQNENIHKKGIFDLHTEP